MAPAIHQANLDIDEELFAELRELEALCGGTADAETNHNNNLNSSKVWGQFEAPVLKSPEVVKPKKIQVEGYNPSADKAKPPVQVEAYVPTVSDTKSVCTDVSDDDSFSELTHQVVDNNNNNSSQASTDGSKFNFRKLVSKENAFQDVVTKAEKTIAELL